MKFIHCADIHLDSPLRGLEKYEGAPVEEIRGATRRAFEEIIRLALDESVDFVLIAGDLYDRDLEDFNTAIFFGRQMARLDEAGIAVCMITGNHDAESKITKKLRNLPKNVKIFSSSMAESLALDVHDVVIHAQSFAKGAVPQDLAAAYPQRQSGKFNIGILHTSLTGSVDHDPYAPTTLEVVS
jgi:DNA repair exonuclease SbcCD nuclease subunit